MAGFTVEGFNLLEEIDGLLPEDNLAGVPAPPPPPSPPKGSNDDLYYVQNLLKEHFPDEATRADLQNFLCDTIHLCTRSSFVNYAKFVLQKKDQLVLKHYNAHFRDDPASTFVRACLEDLLQSHLQIPAVSSVPAIKTIKPEATRMPQTQSASADQRKYWSEMLYSYCTNMARKNAAMHTFLLQYCFDGNSFKQSISVLTTPTENLRVCCPRCTVDIQIDHSVSPYSRHITKHHLQPTPSTKRSADDESSGTLTQTKLKLARIASPPLTSLPPPIPIEISDSSPISTQVCSLVV